MSNMGAVSVDGVGLMCDEKRELILIMVCGARYKKEDEMRALRVCCVCGVRYPFDLKIVPGFDIVWEPWYKKRR